MRIRRRKFRHPRMTRRDEGMRQIADELAQQGESGRAMPGAVQLAPKRAAGEARPAVPPSTGRTEIFTYFTNPASGDVLLYQAESWVRFRLMLETAGPVDVSTRENITPVGSGKGIGLPTNTEIEFVLSKGGRVFIAATALNRVRVIIEPIAWAEQITSMIGTLVSLGRRS